MNLLFGRKQRTHERIDKAKDGTIDKVYVEHKQHELSKKSEKTGKALDKHVIGLYLSGTSHIVRIKDAKKLHQDIGKDPNIRDQMANLGCLLVYNFCNFRVPVLVTAHTVKNLDLCNEDGSYEID